MDYRAEAYRLWALYPHSDEMIMIEELIAALKDANQKGVTNAKKK